MVKQPLLNNDEKGSKPIGARVNIDLWNKVKIQSIREGRKTGEVLDDAIRLYLKSSDSEGD